MKIVSLKLILLLTLSIALSACNETTYSPNKNTRVKQTEEIVKNNKSKVVDNNTVKINTTINSENDSDKPSSVTVFMTDEFKGDASKKVSSFDCHQKMYAVIQLDHYEKGIHEIDVEWIDPYDKTREHTSTPIYVAKNQEFSWSAISLHAATGANLIAWANPAAGMEEFMGEWTIKVSVNKKTASKTNVDVVC